MFVVSVVLNVVLPGCCFYCCCFVEIIFLGGVVVSDVEVVQYHSTIAAKSITKASLQQTLLEAINL